MKNQLQGLAFMAIVIMGMVVAGWLSEFFTDNPIIGGAVFAVLAIFLTAFINALIKRKR